MPQTSKRDAAWGAESRFDKKHMVRSLTPGLCLASHRATAVHTRTFADLGFRLVVAYDTEAVSTLISPGPLAVPSPMETCIASGAPSPDLGRVASAVRTFGKRATGDAWHALFNNHVLVGINRWGEEL